MSPNRLMMNEEKAKLILFGYYSQLKKCATRSLKVGQTSVEKSDVIKYLGMWIDKEL